ncbi:MAG: Hsp20/alpha crystallin family protein [Deltaproteobacteria bacterium]|nr:Hsp20/alpha crystallin family protein [Deltaproteobacteria bacterium]
MTTRTRQPVLFSAIEPLFEMRGLFDDFPWGDKARQGAVIPKMDISENEKALVVTAEVPGFKRDELDVSLHDGVLTISAETTSEEEATEKGEVIRRERYSGKLQRSLSLGENIDAQNIQARLEDGVLTLTLPKMEPTQPEPVQVPIR